MNNFYQKTLKAISLSLISASLLVVFSACFDDAPSEGNMKKDINKSMLTNCLPGQEC